MIDEVKRRGFFIVFGMAFGAWLGGIYAFWSQAVNWLALPGIPLTPPGNNLGQYIIQYVLAGAAFGLVTALPASTGAGIFFGGLMGALAITGLTVLYQWGSYTLPSTIILLFYTFLPLVVLFLPTAYLVRRGTDAQEPDPDRPYLWARRILIPGVLTLVVILFASFSLYPSDVRSAMRFTNRMIQDNLAVQSAGDLPVSLQRVQGFVANASPSYTLDWSDDVESFQGPIPATGGLSQFLIITTFDNGFQFACVFSRTTTVPNCANH